MDWFLYDNGLRHERVKLNFYLWKLDNGEKHHFEKWPKWRKKGVEESSFQYLITRWTISFCLLCVWDSKLSWPTQHFLKAFHYFLKAPIDNLGDQNTKIYNLKFLPDKNFVDKIFPPTKFSSSRKKLATYQGVRNVCFPENLACFLFLKHPFWDSLFCLITADILELVFLIKGIARYTRFSCVAAPPQLSKIENFATIINGFYSLNIFATLFILDVSGVLGCDWAVLVFLFQGFSTFFPFILITRLLNFMEFPRTQVLDPRYTEGPVTVTCLSARQFDLFLRNGSLVFSDFLHNDR